MHIFNIYENKKVIYVGLFLTYPHLASGAVYCLAQWHLSILLTILLIVFIYSSMNIGGIFIKNMRVNFDVLIKREDWYLLLIKYKNLKYNFLFVIHGNNAGKAN